MRVFRVAIALVTIALCGCYTTGPPSQGAQVLDQAQATLESAKAADREQARAMERAEDANRMAEGVIVQRWKNACSTGSTVACANYQTAIINNGPVNSEQLKELCGEGDQIVCQALQLRSRLQEGRLLMEKSRVFESMQERLIDSQEQLNQIGK